MQSPIIFGRLPSPAIVALPPSVGLTTSMLKSPSPVDLHENPRGFGFDKERERNRERKERNREEKERERERGREMGLIGPFCLDPTQLSLDQLELYRFDSKI